MNTLHVIYRRDEHRGDEEWSSYSFPHGVYVAGSSIAEVRAEFRRAATFALGALDGWVFVEHLERPLVPGAYIRVAVDRRMLDRDETAAVMAGTLTVRPQREEFESLLPISATGDGIVIACLPDDRLGWIFEQMGEHDAVAVCSRGPVIGDVGSAWWSFIAGQHAAVSPTRPTGTLADANLTAESTISEFMRVNASATGRTLVGAL